MKVNHIFMMGILGGIYFSSFVSLVAGDFGDESKPIQSTAQSPGRMRRIADLVWRSSFTLRRHSGSSSQEIDNHSVVVSGSPSMSESSVSSSLQAHDDDVLEKAKEGLVGILVAANDIFEKIGYSSAIDTKRQSEVDSIIGVLDHIRDVLSLHRMRAVPDFAAAYEETLTANFSSFHNFDPKSTYIYLGLSVEDGVQTSNEKIRSKMESMHKEREESPQLFRQMEYMFRNSESKHVYDAYMTGGKKAVEDLRVEQKDLERFNYLHEVTVGLKEELFDAYKRTSKK